MIFAIKGCYKTTYTLGVLTRQDDQRWMLQKDKRKKSQKGLLMTDARDSFGEKRATWGWTL